MAYSLSLKVTMEGDHSENSLMSLARKWAQYIMCINVNEGLTETTRESVHESHGRVLLLQGNSIDGDK